MLKSRASCLALTAVLAAATIAAIAVFNGSPASVFAQEPTPTPSSSGSVTTTIDAVDAPGPCLLLSTESIDYGTLAFSTSLTARSATGAVVVTNCGAEPEDILAQGADATGATATWTLADPPDPDDNMCAGVDSGVNRYGHTIHPGFGTPLALTNANQTYDVGTLPDTSLNTTTTFHMPCSDSDGAGELISTSITFTAVTFVPAP